MRRVIFTGINVIFLNVANIRQFFDYLNGDASFESFDDVGQQLSLLMLSVLRSNDKSLFKQLIGSRKLIGNEASLREIGESLPLQTQKLHCS